MISNLFGKDSKRHLRTIKKFAIGFAIIFGITALLGKFLHEPIVALGTGIMERFGLAGLAASVFMVDSIPTPLSYVPFMLLATVGGVPVTVVFLVSSAASYAAGFAGYGLGRVIGMPQRVDQWTRAKHPRIREILDNHGGWGVAAIGALPLPLAVGTWSAGALKIAPSKVALALLIRLPKTALYLLMIDLGLNMGAG